MPFGTRDRSKRTNCYMMFDAFILVSTLPSNEKEITLILNYFHLFAHLRSVYTQYNLQQQASTSPSAAVVWSAKPCELKITGLGLWIVGRAVVHIL